MKKQVSKLPRDYWLNRLYNHRTFTHFKLELEGNQEDYEMSDEDEASSFVDRVLEDAGVNESELTFIEGYNDGSVDTEITLTLPLTEEGVQNGQAIMRAFNRHIDDTRSAGMHISLLGDNAYTSDEQELDEAGLTNLTEQIQPILPFIQLLGQSGNIHRGAYYCSNRVGTSKQGYPAVYIQESKRIEFRFFHPCYDDPELLLHYLEVLSHIVAYYDDPSKKVRLHGSTKTYERLLSTSDFDYFACNRSSILPDTLAFSDIFAQFTGHHADTWRQTTGFAPKTLPQRWADKEYREALRAHKEVKRIAMERLSRDAANWLIGDKTALFDELNAKKVRIA